MKIQISACLFMLGCGYALGAPPQSASQEPIIELNQYKDIDIPSVDSFLENAEILNKKLSLNSSLLNFDLSAEEELLLVLDLDQNETEDDSEESSDVSSEEESLFEEEHAGLNRDGLLIQAELVLPSVLGGASNSVVSMGSSDSDSSFLASIMPSGELSADPPLVTGDATSISEDSMSYEVELSPRLALDDYADGMSSSAITDVSATAVPAAIASSSSGSVAVSSGAGGGGGYATVASVSTRSSAYRPVVFSSSDDYIVHGHVTLTQEDNLYFNRTNATEDYTIHIKGISKTVDGVVQAPTLDGAGLYRGFEIYYQAGNQYTTTISLENVERFQNFRLETDNAKGGAICLFNGGTINFTNTENRIVFEGNKAISTTGHASGGAIFMTGNSSISDLFADFINNEAAVDFYSTGVNYARGGAIFVGRLDTSTPGYYPSSTAKTTIGNIYGNFTGNKAAHGGAIYVAPNGVIGSIHGNFVGNIAEGVIQQGSTTGGANGGAIRVWDGTIGAVYANFSANVVHSVDGSATGGAVSLHGATIAGGITGDYDANIAFSNNNLAQGGAYVLKAQSGTDRIQFTNTDFTNNVAGTGVNSSYTAQGGAFYIENSSDVFFIADGQDVLISENYTVTNGIWDSATNTIIETTESERVYNAIYAKGSTVTLQTAEGKDNTMTINDGIDDGHNGASNLIIEDKSTERYGVKLNGEIGLSHMIVKSGGVELGSFTHADGTVTHGRFTDNANLTVYADAVVKTNASYLDNVGEVDLQGTSRQSAGTIEFTGGTLLSDINGVDKVNTGHINIIGETSISGGAKIYADTVSVHDTLHLLEATSVDVETLFFYGYDMHDVNNGGNQIIADASTLFAFDSIELNFAAANPGDFFDLVVSDDGVGLLNIDFEFEAVVFSVGGQELVKDRDFRVLELADGGVRVEILIKVDPPLIPEPHVAALGLLALAGAAARRHRPSRL